MKHSVSLILSLFVLPLAAQETGDVFQKYEAETKKAVDRGLEFLLTQEQADGGFPESHGRSTGISSLVGMAFLSTGATPGNGKFGEAINRRIDYALKNVDDDGVVAKSGDNGNGPMYAHNISTLFLSEVSGMVDEERQKKIDEALPRAMKVLLRAQAVQKDENNQGGWRYHPNSHDSDLSCSGWALMALRSARLNGAPVPPESIEQAVGYVRRRQNKERGHFGYTDDNQHAESLSGAGLLCMELCGHHGTEENLKAGEYILANFHRLPGAEFELYGNYYNAQGMFQLGGKFWEKYADWMYPNYLSKQKEDGSWEGERFGKTYSTSMMILAMAVPFRQLPIYQRDERVDEE